MTGIRAPAACITHIAVSAAGRQAVATIKARLAARPRDETQSIAERRFAIDAFTADAAAQIPVTNIRVGKVAAEQHGGGDSPGSALLIYAHGGAFVIGSAATHRAFASSIAKASGLPLLAVDYRLAPERPFPAARDDIVAVYAHFAKIPGTRIALVGDSAGGGLILQAALAIRDAGLARPTGIAITSPWVDLGCNGASYASQREADTMLTREGLLLDAGRYLAGRSPDDPEASPVHADLTGLPPVLIQVGAYEILADDATLLASALARYGVTVQLEIWEGMTHAWHVFRAVLPEAVAATDRLGSFLRASVGPA